MFYKINFYRKYFDTKLALEFADRLKRHLMGHTNYIFSYAPLGASILANCQLRDWCFSIKDSFLIIEILYFILKTYFN